MRELLVLEGGTMKSVNQSIQNLTDQGGNETDPGKEHYHHGDLPETLMMLALAHIQQQGTEKLSLRALAREAGVSPTAPYKHFPTKQCLLAALATQGFEDLANRTSDIIQNTPDLRERVVAMGLGYINFAIENPTAYHLMFGSVLGDFSEYEMLRNAAVSSYDQVQKVLREVVQEHDLETDVDQLGGVVWAFVHGFAALMIDNISIGGADAGPMRSIASLQQDPEAALRMMIDPLFNRLN
ncbi:MAG: TetR/AcrR family transcriptional regulator [Pseudomonadota bacterium]